MGGLPDVVFIIDTNKEEIAAHEANKLGIPVIAVIDSNSNPDGIQYPIPGNDDATRAIITYCDLLAQSVLSGLQEELAATGSDVGSEEELPHENLPQETTKSDEEIKGDEEIKKEEPVNGEAPIMDNSAAIEPKEASVDKNTLKGEEASNTIAASSDSETTS